LGGRGSIRALQTADKAALSQYLARHWGSTRMVAHGRLFEITDLPGFVAERDEEWLGHAAYKVSEGGMEVVLLGATDRGGGVGSALLAECALLAAQRSLHRLWLVTTNDNVDGLRFYQRRGFVMVAVRPGAVTEARRTLKPEIPDLGEYGIPLRDEIELELPRPEWDGLIASYGW
jgi:GNAT superfamily N-acetyltransferase